MTTRVQCTVLAAPDAAGADPVTFPVAVGARVLHEMLRGQARPVPVGCRGGGCGVCRVRVLQGDYHALRMSRRHVSAEEQQRGIALACRLVPRTDLVIQCAPVPDAGPGDHHHHPPALT
jgi:ferredoxin